LLTVDFWKNTEKVITPFCPPNIKTGGEKPRNLQELKLIVAESGALSKKDADNKYH
jgi:hypothetical protein